MEVLNAFLSGPYINWLRRNEDGVIVVRQEIAPWVSYHTGVDPRTKPNCRKSIRVCYKDGDYWRVEWKDRFSRETFCRGDAQAFEADVNPIRRVLSNAEEVKIQKPRRLYFDLETDSRVPFMRAREGEARILSWAATDDHGNVFSGLLNFEDDEDECRLLAEFWKVAEGYDCLLAWNGDSFDFNIIQVRTKMLGAYEKDLRRWTYLDHMLVFKKNNLNNAETAEEKTSLKLNDVAQALVGEGKNDLDASKAYEHWKTKPQELLAYNIQDVLLMPKIEAKTGYLEVIEAICQICRLFPDSSCLAPTRQVDAYILQLGAKIEYHGFPSKWYGDLELKAQEKFQGALVIEPEHRGILHNIHVSDFKSLYPSVILSWNISPETKVKEGGALCPKTGIRFSQDKRGLLAIALENLLQERKQYQKAVEESDPYSPEWVRAGKLSMGVKVINNGFYGVIGNMFSRYYDKEIAESVALTGRWVAEKVVEAIKARGMIVTYGDTDSQWVDAKGQDYVAFVDWVNREYVPQLLEECGCKYRGVFLEYEKEWDWVVHCTDNTGNPVCKKYVGVFKTFGGKKVDKVKAKVIGLELKRSDSIRLGRTLQQTVIDMLVAGDHNSMKYEELVAKWRMRVLQEPLSIEEISQSKSISMALKDYKQQNAAHVRIAKMLEEEGEDAVEGTRVSWYVKNSNVSPMDVGFIEDYNNDADRGYYWEKKIYPPTMRILAGAFPNIPWHRYSKGSNKDKVLPGQLGLFT